MQARSSAPVSRRPRRVFVVPRREVAHRSTFPCVLPPSDRFLPSSRGRGRRRSARLLPPRRSHVRSRPTRASSTPSNASPAFLDHVLRSRTPLCVHGPIQRRESSFATSQCASMSRANGDLKLPSRKAKGWIHPNVLCSNGEGSGFTRPKRSLRVVSTNRERTGFPRFGTGRRTPSEGSETGSRHRSGCRGGRSSGPVPVTTSERVKPTGNPTKLIGGPGVC